MKKSPNSAARLQRAILGSAVSLGLLSGLSTAQAGGLAIREQSTQFMGTAFAGNAAGGGLSSMFWNSASLGEAKGGLHSESNVTLILPSSEFTVTNDQPFIGGAGTTQTQDRPAWLTSSYYSYRVNDKLALGLAVNSPFGLANEVEPDWAGRLQHRSAALLTVNANPMAAFEVMPGVHIGAGVQIQFAQLRFKTANGTSIFNPNAASTKLKGDDLSLGYTAGILLKPAEGTSIGIGYRSSVAHSIRGNGYNIAVDNGLGGFVVIPQTSFRLDVDTPQMITASFRQAVTSSLRLMGTVEWTNWGNLDINPIYLNNFPSGSNFDFQWHDGWYFALGGEYDWSDRLTLRAGGAYEISPIKNPSERLLQAPDSDRTWLSFGATYKYSEAVTFDLAYTHIFVEDSRTSRTPANGNAAFTLDADVESKVDIFSVGLKIDTHALMGSLF